MQLFQVIIGSCEIFTLMESVRRSVQNELHNLSIGICEGSLPSPFSQLPNGIPLDKQLKKYNLPF
jgi:hypothetical protein